MKRLLLFLALAVAAHAGSFTVGLNYAWYQESGQHFYGRLFGEMTDAQRTAIESHFADMQGAGITRLRIWLFADGWRWPERANGTFKPLTPAFLFDLTWFVRRAFAHGIRVQPSLWDFYLNRTHPEYLRDPAVLPQLIATVIAPLARALAHEPGFLSFDLFNEPEWIIADMKTDGEARSTGNPPVPFATVAAWVRAHADAIHAAGATCTLGSAAPTWVARWKGLGLDEYQVHYYPRLSQWEGNLMFRWLPAVSKLGLDRPCTLGEFPPNHRLTDVATVLGMIREKGYAGAWAWEYFGDGFPENLAHPFSFHARKDEFRTFTAQNR